MKKNLIIPMLAAIMAMLWGCTNEENMGGDLVPPSDRTTVHVIDTVTVRAYTELEDTVVISGSNLLIAGTSDDPIFGKTTASFAAKFSNSSYSKFKAGMFCDSLVLTLGLDTNIQRFYGDSLSEVTMNVYKLTDTLSLYKTYDQYFDINSIVEQEPIASTTFVPSQADTMVKFYLPREYGDMVIQSARDTTFDDNCGGFYFTIQSSNTLVRFSVSSSFSEYSLYYRTDSDTTDKVAYFSMRNDDQRLSFFTHDYSNTKFVDNLDGSAPVQDTSLYLQTMVGTKIRLDFPYLNSLLALNGKYSVITNARLIMPMCDSLTAMEDKYQPINFFVVGGKTYSGQVVNVSDFVTQSTQLSTPFRTRFVRNYERRWYQVNMTNYIVKQLNAYQNGTQPYYYLYVAPYGLVSDFTRSVINSPTHSKNPMRLVIEYVEFDK